MGKIFNKEIARKLNEIGYTRKLKGKKISREDFLNSISKGESYSLKCIRRDNGDFCEAFELTITRAKPTK